MPCSFIATNSTLTLGGQQGAGVMTELQFVDGLFVVFFKADNGELNQGD